MFYRHLLAILTYNRFCL